MSLLWLLQAAALLITYYACARRVQSCDQQILPMFLASCRGPGSGVGAGNTKVPKTQPQPLRGSQGSRKDESKTLRGSGPRGSAEGCGADSRGGTFAWTWKLSLKRATLLSQEAGERE